MKNKEALGLITISPSTHGFCGWFAILAKRSLTFNALYTPCSVCHRFAYKIS